MNIDDNEISNKSQMTTLVLLLFFGSLGLHRFYVNKYITGILFIVVGWTSIAFDLLGFGFDFLSRILFLAFLLFDLYAIYSDSFTDKKGKLVVGKSNVLVYESYEERERIIFDDRLNKIMVTCLALGLYIAYFMLNKFVL